MVFSIPLDLFSSVYKFVCLPLYLLQLGSIYSSLSLNTYMLAPNF
jgi:hypothetical protein